MKSIIQSALTFLILFTTSNVYSQLELMGQSHNFGPVIPDTIYYPFYKGVQMIEINTSSAIARIHWRYDCCQNQPPPGIPKGRLGDEYIFRDKKGVVIKTFNTSKDWTQLASTLKFPSSEFNFHHNRHETFYPTLNYGSQYVNGFYRILNYSSENFNHQDPSTNHIVKHGLIDSLGNVVFEPEYEMIEILDNAFLVKKDGKWGLVNDKFKVVSKIEFSSILDHGDLFYHAKAGKIVSVYSLSTKKRVHYERLHSILDYDQGLFKSQKDGKWGLMDVMTKEWVIPCIYDEVGYYYYPNAQDIKTYGYVIVKKNGKYGVVNLLGKVVLPCKYDKLLEWTKTNKGWFKVMIGEDEYEVEEI